MWPMLGGLFSGLGSLAGGMFSAEQSGENTQAQIAASQQQQATQNAFSERMSNTAYQRASQDMQQAGLNPSMMFGSGGAASSPTGSGIQAPMPQTKSAFEGLGEATSKVVSSAISAKTFEKMTEEIANLQTDAARTRAVTENVKQQTETEKHETLKRADEAALRGLSLPAARVSAKEAEAVEKMPMWLRDALSIGSYSGSKASDAIGPVLSSARAVRSFLPDKREVTRSGSRWNSRGEENHYEDSTFERRFTGHGGY